MRLRRARSGLVLRVHPDRALRFACLLSSSARSSEEENKLESLVSRESSFLFNNLILLAACFTVLWGTLFPVLSEYVQGTKVTVGAPFYNRVNMPIGLFLLFLTGIGPLLAWRSTSLRRFGGTLFCRSIAMGVAAVALMIGGRAAVERWGRYAVDAVLAGDVYAGGGCDHGDFGGVSARGEGGADADGQESAGVDGAADAAQYAAVWRVHGSLRHRGDVYRDCRAERSTRIASRRWALATR
jgi:hypothetical protein